MERMNLTTTVASGPLVLADISGYTALLQGVTDAHPDAFVGGVIPPAFGMLSSLVDGIVGRLVPPFTLAKLEGDAVFAYGTDPTAMPQGEYLLACVAECYADFHNRLIAAREIWTCTCSACDLHPLELKFILHFGSFAIQQIAGQQEIAGTDVVVAHRLMKNGASQALGTGAYLLMTQRAVDWLQVPTESATRLVETYDHIGPVQVYAVPLVRP